MYSPEHFQVIGMYSPVINKFITTLDEAEQHFANNLTMQQALNSSEKYKQYKDNIKAANKNIDEQIKQRYKDDPSITGANTWNTIQQKYALERRQAKEQNERDLKLALAELKQEFATRLAMTLEDIKLREDWDKAEYKKSGQPDQSGDPVIAQLQSQRATVDQFKAFKRDAEWRLYTPTEVPRYDKFIPKHITTANLEAMNTLRLAHMQAWPILLDMVLYPIGKITGNTDLPHCAAVFEGYCIQYANGNQTFNINSPHDVYEFAREQVMPYVVMELSEDDRARVHRDAARFGGFERVRNNCWITNNLDYFSV